MRCFCRWIALFALTLSIVFGCASAEEYPVLTVPLVFETVIPQDIDEVEAAVCHLTREKIGADVDLIPLLRTSSTQSDARRRAELNLLVKEGFTFDLLNPQVPDYREQLIPLDDLLAQYGKDILAIADPEKLENNKTDGVLFSLPVISSYTCAMGIAMRKDIVERYDIDLSAIDSADDLTAVFEIVKRNEPTLQITCGYRTSFSLLSMLYDDVFIDDTVFALSDDGKTLVNYYATEDFRAEADLVRDWYERGYVAQSLSMQALSAYEMIRSGELFSFFSAYKPGITHENSLICEREMVCVQLTPPLASRTEGKGTRWGISKNCPHPEKAMQFLNLLYTDSELINLLAYGIEDMHYVLAEDGSIDYPKGVTAATVGYINTTPWMLPNQRIAHVFTGYDADVFAPSEAFSSSGRLLDFSFDDAAVSQQHAAVNAVANRYAYGLTTGRLDPDVYLPQMLADMEAAGLADVQAEIQRQYDGWVE